MTSAYLTSYIKVNNIGNEGITALAPKLAQQTGLQTLNLSCKLKATITLEYLHFFNWSLQTIRYTNRDDLLYKFENIYYP